MAEHRVGIAHNVRRGADEVGAGGNGLASHGAARGSGREGLAAHLLALREGLVDKVPRSRVSSRRKSIDQELSERQPTAECGEQIHAATTQRTHHGAGSGDGLHFWLGGKGLQRREVRWNQLRQASHHIKLWAVHVTTPGAHLLRKVRLSRLRARYVIFTRVEIPELMKTGLQSNNR